MMGYWDGMGGWGVALVLVGNVLLWVVIILAVVALVRHLARDGRPPAAGSRPTPEQLLGERFARGELDEQEYRSRLETLSQARVER